MSCPFHNCPIWLPNADFILMHLLKEHGLMSNQASKLIREAIYASPPVDR
jgi:hypothetical protein